MSEELKIKINALTNKLIGVSPSIGSSDDSYSTMASLLQECLETSTVSPEHSEVIDLVNETITDVFSKDTSLSNGMDIISSKFTLDDTSSMNMKNFIEAVIDARHFAFENPGLPNPHTELALRYSDAIATDIGAGIIQKARDVVGYGKGKLRARRSNAAYQVNPRGGVSFEFEDSFSNPFENSYPAGDLAAYTQENPNDLGKLRIFTTLDKEPVEITLDFSKDSGASNGWKTMRSYKTSTFPIFYFQKDFEKEVKGYNAIDFSKYSRQTVPFIIQGSLYFDGNSAAVDTPMKFPEILLRGNLNLNMIKKHKGDVTVKASFMQGTESGTVDLFDVEVQLQLKRSNTINSYKYWISAISLLFTPLASFKRLGAGIEEMPELVGDKRESPKNFLSELPIVFHETEAVDFEDFSEELQKVETKVIKHPEDNISLVFEYSRNDESFLVDTGFQHQADYFSDPSLQMKKDKSFVDLHWKKGKSHQNLQTAYAINLSKQEDGPLNLKFSLSYFPCKLTHHGKSSHGSFFRKHTFERQFEGIPSGSSAGWLTTIVDFHEKKDLKRRYKHGLLLCIEVSQMINDPTIVSINQIRIMRIFSEEHLQSILRKFFSPQTESIGGFFSNVYKKMLWKKRDPIQRIRLPAQDSLSQEDQTPVEPLTLASYHARKVDRTEKQSSTSFDASRLTSWSERSSNRSDIVLVDVASMGYRDILNTARVAQVDAFTRDAQGGNPEFKRPSSIDYIKLINRALVNVKPPEAKKDIMLYDLSGIENANPDAVYEIDFTATDQNEQYQIMSRWAWYETPNASSLVIIPRPPYDVSAWAFTLDSSLKIDAELAINGVSYSLQSALFTMPTQENIRKTQILRLAPIKNKVINLVLQDKVLQYIVIQHDKDIIVPEVPSLSPLPIPSSSPSSSTSTSQPSSSRGWRLMRLQSPRATGSETFRRLPTSYEMNFKGITIYRATDPAVDEVLEKITRFQVNKIKPATKPTEWLKNFKLTDQVPGLIPGTLTVNTFFIEFLPFVVQQTGSSPLASKQQWKWAQEIPTSDHMGRIFIVPDKNYKPLLTFEKIEGSREHAPRTWLIGLEYPDGTKRIETHSFELEAQEDAVIAIILHTNIHLYVYLRLFRTAPYFIYTIEGIVLVNNGRPRQLPRNVLPLITEKGDKKLTISSAHGNKFLPDYSKPITKETPGIVRLPTSASSPQPSSSSMVFVTPSVSSSSQSEEQSQKEKENQGPSSPPVEVLEEQTTEMSEDSSAVPETSTSETSATLPSTSTSTSTLSILPSSSSSTSSSKSQKKSQVVTELKNIEDNIQNEIEIEIGDAIENEIEDAIGDEIEEDMFEFDPDLIAGFL